MTEWEARYKALAAGIEDPVLIENADKLVRVAIASVQSSASPFVTLEATVNVMLRTIQVLREKR